MQPRSELLQTLRYSLERSLDFGAGRTDSILHNDKKAKFAEMKTELIEISKLETNEGQIKGLPANPRTISKSDFEKMKKSLQDLPDMMNLREVIVFPHGKNFVAIGGNMRLRAAKELKWDKVPCKVLSADTSVKTLKEIAIKDNGSFGDNDMELIANEWADLPLADWGLDVPKIPKELQKDKDWEPAFKIVIEFGSEKAQLKALSELEKKGYKCQLLML